MFKVLSSISIVFLLQGCFELDLKVNIHDDGHAAAHAHYDFSEFERIPALRNSLNDFNCENKFAIDSSKGECTQTHNGVIDINFYDVDLYEDGSLKIINKLFITEYELDVNRMLKAFGQNTENNIQQDTPNFRKLGARYDLTITMPGGNIIKNGFNTNAQTTIIDGLDILLDQEKIILKSEKYNVGNIIALFVVLGCFIFIVYRKNAKLTSDKKVYTISIGLMVSALLFILMDFYFTRSFSSFDFNNKVLIAEEKAIKNQQEEQLETSTTKNVTCKDLEYGSEHYSENMDQLAKDSHFKDNYWNRYHEDVKSSLCRGDIDSVYESIDSGYVSKSDAEGMIRVLGLSYDINNQER